MATVRQAPATYGLDRSRWRLVDLRERLPYLAGYSLAGISTALRRLKVSRQRGRLSVHSPDPAYPQKLRWVQQALALARAPEHGVTMLYADEFSFYRHPTLAPTYASQGQAPVARCSASANTRYRVCGAIDAATGELTYLADSKIGVVNLKRFLKKLRRRYPDQTLVLVWDNWPIHYHAEVLATAAELAIHLLWLPTYAPWTNPIEKLWRWCKQELLHHHRWTTRWSGLRQRVRAWLDRFARPAPDLLRYVGLVPK